LAHNLQCVALEVAITAPHSQRRTTGISAALRAAFCCALRLPMHAGQRKAQMPTGVPQSTHFCERLRLVIAGAPSLFPCAAA